MEAAAAATAADLKRRLEEKREALATTRTGSEGSITTIDNAFEPEDRTATCTECNEPFMFRTFRGSTLARLVCDGCAERQQITEAAAERAARADAERRLKRAREEQLLELIERAGANPAEHGRATLATFDVDEAGYRPVQLCQRFIADCGMAGRYDEVRGLYLWGGTGTGKTHLAVAVLRQLLADVSWNPNSVVYDHAAELVARIQSTYGSKGDTFEVLERRFNARLWILDDLGTERASDDVARHLTLIFTRRAMRPTLVTSNISPEQMETERPELQRVVSRLGPGYFRACEVKGRDRRFDQ